MALNDAAFAGVLKNIFDQMDSAASGTPKTNQWYADQLAQAIDAQIKTAEVKAGIAVAGSTASGGAITSAATAAKGSLE